MLRPLAMSFALAGTAVVLAFLAARPARPASEQREAVFAPDGCDRFVDANGCVVDCCADVQTEFGHCSSSCEVNP